MAISLGIYPIFRQIHVGFGILTQSQQGRFTLLQIHSCTIPLLGGDFDHRYGEESAHEHCDSVTRRFGAMAIIYIYIYVIYIYMLYIYMLYIYICYIYVIYIYCLQIHAYYLHTLQLLGGSSKLVQ